MTGEDMVRAPSRVLSTSAQITRAQVEDELFGHLQQLADADRAISRPVSVNFLQRLSGYVERLRLAQSTSPELVKLGEAAVKWARHNECYGSAYDDREAFLGAAKDYARSVKDRADG